jgi:hypothetical protein
VWIDYDQDGFLSSLDVVFESEELTTEPIDTFIIIPDAALEGQTRMRVIMKFNGEPSSCVSDAVNFFGEVEDYCVSIEKRTSTSTSNRLPLPARMNIFPNPSSDEVNLQIHTSESLDRNTLQVLDINGRIIWQEQRPFLPKGKNNIRLSAKNWNPGMYFFRLQSEGGLLTRKLLVQ